MNTSSSEEPDANSFGIHKKSFYNFWLQYKTIEENEIHFKELLSSLNKGSKNGPLFSFSDQGKVKVMPTIHGKGTARSLAGFLKFCIDEQKLSNKILHHSHRKLLEDVFILDEATSLTILQQEKFEGLSEGYIDVYRKIHKS